MVEPQENALSEVSTRVAVAMTESTGILGSVVLLGGAVV